jgi:hypothetical protein
MDLAQMEELLAMITPSPPFASERGIRDDVSVLRISKDRSSDGRWIVISTPGDRWFSVQTDGGFALNHFEEDTPDDFVADLLGRYVAIGIAYLNGGSYVSRPGRLGLRVLHVEVDGEAYELRRYIVSEIKSFFRRR